MLLHSSKLLLSLARSSASNPTISACVIGSSNAHSGRWRTILQSIQQSRLLASLASPQPESNATPAAESTSEFAPSPPSSAFPIQTAAVPGATSSGQSSTSASSSPPTSQPESTSAEQSDPTAASSSPQSTSVTTSVEHLTPAAASPATFSPLSNHTHQQARSLPWSDQGPDHALPSRERRPDVMTIFERHGSTRVQSEEVAQQLLGNVPSVLLVPDGGAGSIHRALKVAARAGEIVSQEVGGQRLIFEMFRTTCTRTQHNTVGLITKLVPSSHVPPPLPDDQVLLRANTRIPFKDAGFRLANALVKTAEIHGQALLHLMGPTQTLAVMEGLSKMRYILRKQGHHMVVAPGFQMVDVPAGGGAGGPAKLTVLRLQAVAPLDMPEHLKFGGPWAEDRNEEQGEVGGDEVGVDEIGLGHRAKL